jgi:hypothetical protein
MQKSRKLHYVKIRAFSFGKIYREFANSMNVPPVMTRRIFLQFCSNVICSLIQDFISVQFTYSNSLSKSLRT